MHAISKLIEMLYYVLQCSKIATYYNIQSKIQLNLSTPMCIKYISIVHVVYASGKPFIYYIPLNKINKYFKQSLVIYKIYILQKKKKQVYLYA